MATDFSPRDHRCDGQGLIQGSGIFLSWSLQVDWLLRNGVIVDFASKWLCGSILSVHNQNPEEKKV